MHSDSLLKLVDPKIQEHIFLHEKDDERKLVLSQKEILGIPSSLIASQIQGRKKAKYKLPNWYETRGIIYPPTLNLEQSSSEATAQFKTFLINKGKVGCDLTGGFGVDAFYISQHFEKFYYVEPDENLLSITKHNHFLLGAQNIEYVHSTAEEFFHQISEQFDLVFIDPSRRNKNQKVFKLADCIPDVTILLSSLLDKSNQVLIKASPLLDIQQAVQELSHIEKIFVVALNNECKELMFSINRTSTSSPGIHAIDIISPGTIEDFSFSIEEEKNNTVEFSTPLTWLYEPNAAILKSGAFKTLALRYNLKKLHPSTHLYTSDEKLTHFPGRTFKVIQETKLDKKVKDLFSNGQANILTRNYPLSVEEIKKKTRLIEGGSRFLICTRSKDEKHVLIAEKVN